MRSVIDVVAKKFERHDLFFRAILGDRFKSSLRVGAVHKQAPVKPTSLTNCNTSLESDSARVHCSTRLASSRLLNQSYSRHILKAAEVGRYKLAKFGLCGYGGQCRLSFCA